MSKESLEASPQASSHDQNGNPQHLIASGTLMMQEFAELYDKFSAILPDPESWKHPDKARKAVEGQMDWSERTLNRNTMDFVDKCRDHILITLKNSNLENHQVDYPTVDRAKNTMVMRKIPLKDLLLRGFKDIRQSVLRHQNAYFRQMRYFFEFQITGGQIPSFPYTEEDNDRMHRVPIHDSSTSGP